MHECTRYGDLKIRTDKEALDTFGTIASNHSGESETF